MDTIVPNCPSGLCISKQDFLKQDFSVDNFFIEQSVRDTPLDSLRDDLGVYLKVLRSSMIELINEDYADFVNLSTNLVGLDKCILKIQEPLSKHQAEVMKVYQCIQDTLTLVREKLEAQGAIREKKGNLSNLQHIWEALIKVERMLGVSERKERSAEEGGEEGGCIPIDVAERIAADTNHLLFCVWKMKESSLIQDIQPRIDTICDTLNSSLDHSLLQGLKERNRDLISQCCRIYATIDRIPQAELLVRERVVLPVVSSILTETNLENEPHGLKGLYSQVIQVIPENISELLNITSGSINVQEKRVEGFDFLVNAFWPAVADTLHENLGFIFSPGNPEEFFRNYTVSMGLVGEVENCLYSEESVTRLRNSSHYNRFIKAWSLPIYFQIRFQEISTPYESCLLGGGTLERAEAGSDWRLRATQEATAAIQKSFAPDVFLLSIGDRFLKLAMQVVARYRTWGEYCLKAYDLSQSESHSAKLKKSTTTKDFQDIHDTQYGSSKSSSLRHPQPALPRRSASDMNLSEQVVEEELTVLFLSLTDLVRLHSDTVELGRRLPSLLGVVHQLLGGEGEQESVNKSIELCISGSVANLFLLLPQIETKIVGSASGEPIKLLKQVADIPRMYRRTNREIPSKPCSYITGIVDRLQEFQDQQRPASTPASLEKWLCSVVENITSQYLLNVTDVLTNVTKMEESLRKLKKVRDRTGGGGGSKGAGSGSGGAAGAGLSDDDKIRLQLYLDVMYFSREVEKWGMSAETGNMSEMKTVVTIATKGFHIPQLPEAEGTN